MFSCTGCALYKCSNVLFTFVKHTCLYVMPLQVNKIENIPLPQESTF